MRYPFEKKTYPIYPKTFLKDVRICLTHTPIDIASTSPNDLSFFFDKKYNIKNVTLADIQKGLAIEAENQQIKIEFKNDTILVLMKCPAYKSFNLALILIGDIIEYFEITNISYINKCQISKYDEVEFKNNKNYIILNVMKNVFSENLIAKLSENETKTFKELSRWEKVLEFEDDTDFPSRMIVEYGFSLRGVERQQGFLTLKTQIESTITTIPTDELMNLLEKHNHILDNAFHWCIKPEIINIMKES